MTLILDRFNELLADVTREMPAPTAPFGYGTDIRCRDDVDEQMRDVDPFSRDALVDALVRRLDCPRGSLPGDRNYGISLRSYVNRGTTQADLVALGAQVRGELMKDDRVRDVTVPLPTFSGGVLHVVVIVDAVDPLLGTFALTLAVTDGELLLQEIRSV